MPTTTSPFDAIIPYGKPKKHSVYIGGSDFTSQITYFSFLKKLNEPGIFQVDLLGISGTDTRSVREGNRIMMFDGPNLFFRGEIEKMDIDSTGAATITGLSAASSVLKRRTINTRKEYTGSSLDNIFINILSKNLDGGSPFVVGTGTHIGFGGSPVIRAEYDNRLNAIENLANVAGADWWESYSGGKFNIELMNMGSFRGLGYSLKDYYTGGSLQNAFKFERTNETNSLVNRVIILGRGDGPNQVSGVAENTTSQELSGVWERIFIDKSINDAGWAGSSAQDILDDFKNPNVRGVIHVPPISTYDSGIDVGEIVTVTDRLSKLSGSPMRILSMERTFGDGFGTSLRMDLISAPLGSAAGGGAGGGGAGGGASGEDFGFGITGFG